MKDRNEALEDSMLGIGSKYKHYSLGRTRVLKKLGNPFFGGTPDNPDDWDVERRMGTAWVVFTKDFDEIEALMNQPDPLKAIDRIWQEQMHNNEIASVYDYVIEQAGLSESAETEAVPEKGGKQG